MTFENFEISDEIINILLWDNSSKKNIIWANDDYSYLGKGYSSKDFITLDIIKKNIIHPRVVKEQNIQRNRTSEKAEVFTPAWVCNLQNNLIDNSWFGREGVFNIEKENSWETVYDKVEFPKDKSWEDYVNENRLEVTCGEAPYLVSRYDVANNTKIDVKDRIGILDRKLRIVNENATEENWLDYYISAYKATYGFEFQGDNLFIARLNLLLTFLENCSIFNHGYGDVTLKEIARIISWNLWQMDGLKMVVPLSCKSSKDTKTFMFGTPEECFGCKYDDVHRHNGIYCSIMDWQGNKPVKFLSLIRE